MIDLHCHLLPGVDDGARDLDEALEMARALVALGFTQVAASPHMGMGPGGDVDPEVAATTMALLKVTLQEQQIPLTVSTNAEHYLSPELFERISLGRVRTLGGQGRWLLVELPWGGIPNVETVVFRLQSKGYRLLLAHPERTEFLPISQCVKLVERGVRVQLEVGSFSGVFGPAAQERAVALFEQGAAHVVATDLHRLEDAKGGLAYAVAEFRHIVGDAAAQAAWSTNPQRLLDDATAEQIRPLVEAA